MTEISAEITAEFLLDKLEAQYALQPIRNSVLDGASKYLFVRELRVGTGIAKGSAGRIDAFVLALLPSLNFERIAYEVKISRADFRRDLAKRLKHRPARLHVNKFFYVAPEGVIPADEVPIWAGLLELKEPDGRQFLWKTIDAPWVDTSPPTWSFVSALIRRVQDNPE